ncbi:MAG: peptidase M61 [Bacteroidota bacterium]
MNKFKNSVALLLLIISISVYANDNNKLKYAVSIVNTMNDKLQVELQTPANFSGEVQFCFPKMIPGTYSIYDFGKFVGNLSAYDKSGNKIEVERSDINSWKIKNANQLSKISYTVDDTWDTDSSNFVFEPAGSGFSSNKYFMFNNHAIFGYFKQNENLPIELKVNKPSGFYGATSTLNSGDNKLNDVFNYKNYHELVDSPILYAKPDTATFYVGKTKVLVALYDEGLKVNAKFLAEQVKPVLQAASNYFGGNLPVDNYSFLVHLFKGKSKSGSNGALEHSYSSVYYLPSQQGAQLAQYFKDIAAHEFYHVITPLNIHSKEIGDFNYATPQMSRHLWLYEGVTEYFSHYVQFRAGLLTKQQYIDVLNEKVEISSKYYNDTLPFTTMSKGCLDKHKKQYGNVYQKGALIALGLDLLLLEKSNGEYNLQRLINELSLKYGKDNSFEDENLFDEITKMTYPEVGEYFANYVDGNQILPLEKMFASIGVDFKREVVKKGFSLGSPKLAYDYPKSKLFHVSALNNENEMCKAFGYQVGDKLYSLNGKKLNLFNFGMVTNTWVKLAKEGDKVKVVVLRKNEKGKYKKTKLYAVAKLVDVKSYNSFEDELVLDQAQQKMYNKWCCN